MKREYRVDTVRLGQAAQGGWRRTGIMVLLSALMLGTLCPAALSASGSERLGADTRVSLQLRQADVRHVFEILARQGGVNVLVGRGVNGRVSVSLDHITLSQALTYLSALCGATLTPVEEGKTLLVSASAPAIATLAPDAAMRTLAVRYRRAADLARHLEQTLGANAPDSRLGRIMLRVSADTPGNRLVLAGTAQALDQAVNTLAQLDTPLPSRTYTLRSRRPTPLARMIAATFGGEADVPYATPPESSSAASEDTPLRAGGLTLIPDSRHLTLTVQGNAEQLALIDAWMLTHDRPARAVTLDVSLKRLTTAELNALLARSARLTTDAGVISPETLQLIGQTPRAQESGSPVLHASTLEETTTSVQWQAPALRAAQSRASLLALELTPTLGLDESVWLSVRQTLEAAGHRVQGVSLPACRLRPGQTLALVIAEEATTTTDHKLTVWITPRLEQATPDEQTHYRRYTQQVPATRTRVAATGEALP